MWHIWTLKQHKDYKIMRKEVLEIRFEKIFHGVYQFDDSLIQEARRLQKTGNRQESVDAYRRVKDEYEKKLGELLKIEPQARTTFISPLCIVEESRFDADLKQSTTIYEYSAKLFLAEAMIAELTGEGEVKVSLEKAADFYKKMASNLSLLAGGCNQWEDMAQIMFKSDARQSENSAEAILRYLNPQEVRPFTLDVESKRHWLEVLYKCLSHTALNVWTIPMDDNNKACKSLLRAFSAETPEERRTLVVDAHRVCPSFLSAHVLADFLLAVLDKSDNVVGHYESCLSRVAWQTGKDDYYQRIHHLFAGLIAAIEMEDVDQSLAYCMRLAEYLPLAESEVRTNEFKGRYWKGYGDPIIPKFNVQELVDALSVTVV